jgi:CheY-like chemotaxis protein
MYDVLALDDDEAVRVFLESFFRMHGWRAQVVADVGTAFDILHSDGARLFFTDINMPGMGGVACAREVRQKYPDVTVIALTGSAQELDLSPADFHEVLKKPCLVEDLSRALCRHLPAPEGIDAPDSLPGRSPE